MGKESQATGLPYLILRGKKSRKIHRKNKRIINTKVDEKEHKVVKTNEILNGSQKLESVGLYSKRN